MFGRPRWSHPLGLDDGGIDMLTLLMWGARISLVVGFAATFVSMVIGGAVGVARRLLRRPDRHVLMRITDYFLVIPDVPLMIVVAAIWGPSLFHIVDRDRDPALDQHRAGASARRSRACASASTSSGRARSAPATPRIIFRHVLPQVAPLLIANTVLTVAVAIFDETALAFLGLGDPSRISLGQVIENAFQRAAISSGAWWAIVPPGALSR